MTRRQRLVLLGGGHAHLFVLRAFGRRPMPNLEITLVAKEVMAPYSGMLPGYVAGHYALDDCSIDLKRLARFADARVLAGEAVAIDRRTRTVALRSGERLAYDALSIDVGIAPDTSGIAGAQAHALLVKPISAFAPKWQDLLDRVNMPDGPRRIVAIGGGAAGIELILAAHWRITGGQAPIPAGERPFSFTLVAGMGVLPSHPPRARRLARAALAHARVDVIEHDTAVEIAPGRIRLRSGRWIDADAAIVSTQAKAPAWFADTGLVRDVEGYLALRPTLQTLTDDDIFAAGDCASVIVHPRPKAGVFAVRQGPVLAEHLRRHLAMRLLDPFEPQRKFLTLISLGGKSAIASRGSLAVAGRWAWRLKDYIDRRFAAGFKRL